MISIARTKAAFLKALYRNLRIKQKLFLLFFFVMIIVCSCFMIVLQYVYRVYDEEIHSQAAQSLSVTSFGIENELIKLENLTFRLATDATLQSYLSSVKAGNTEYEQFVTTRDIKERLMALGGSEKYVLSMQLVDANDHEYGTGVRPINTPIEKMRRVSALAEQRQGGNIWALPDSSDSSLIAAREIRSYFSHVNIDLERLGFIMTRVHLDRLIADYSRGLDNKDVQLIIMSGDEMIYPRSFPERFIGIRDKLPEAQGYTTIELQRNKYFATHLPSNYSNWTYVIISPYDSIFYAINNVKHFVLLIMIAIVSLTLLLSISFARSITRPIESLNSKMKRVQMGDFANLESDRELPLFSDEAGQMHRNFRIMLDRINELINENFKKQIAIKDSEFKALQAQINPHFLYNTLESINWLAKMAGQQRISTMVESLGYLLRNSISNKQALTTIHEELSSLEHYITIQSFRFQERLSFSSNVPAHLLQCSLPRMSLQPLVENAIKHGLENMLETCVITITAEHCGNEVTLSVTDNGPGFPSHSRTQWQEAATSGGSAEIAILPEADDASSQGTGPSDIHGVKTAGSPDGKSGGIGLRNIHDRITLLFGHPYGLTLKRDQNLTSVLIRIPYRKEMEHHVQRAAGG